MNLFFSPQVTKEDVFDQIREELTRNNFTIINDEKRAWGGFFVIEENQAALFIATYFSSLSKDEIPVDNKLSPKILIVEAGKRLSWQYHHRRAEIWKVIGAKAGVIRSDNDEENPLEIFDTGDIIRLKMGERHRLVGLDNWGIIAEIWQHTDINEPSNEDDIVRLSDDFGR
jgi:mannose-6-phosphate isomerase